MSRTQSAAYSQFLWKTLLKRTDGGDESRANPTLFSSLHHRSAPFTAATRSLCGAADYTVGIQENGCRR
jgi:hypothetical protein